MVTRAPRLLVKAMQMPQGAAFNVGKIPFTLHPLFPGSRRADAMGAAPASEWHLTDIPTDVDESDLWDLCHQLQTKGFGIAGGPAVEFAEPDLEQQWIVNSPDRLAAKAFAASAGDTCRNPYPRDSRYPSPAPFDWRWFQDTNHSGLDGARSQINNPSDRITIAHLDTGYRKGHDVLPRFLDTTRQRSFVDADSNPNDASDPGIEGFGNNPGHGTGTLSILAGSLFNGAPFGKDEPSFDSAVDLRFQPRSPNESDQMTAEPKKNETNASGDATQSLQTFDLTNLEQYTREKNYASTASKDFHLFYVGRDDVRDILKHVLSRVCISLYLNMFGFDDDELNDILMTKAKDSHVLMMVTLDRSQAGGKHEKRLLDSDIADDPVAFNTYFVIGQSATHQISHTKGFVADGKVGGEGSTNWSASGEGTFVAKGQPGSKEYKAQNNTQSIFTDPDTISRFLSELIAEHMAA